MKLGIIGEEMLATAIRLASDPDAQVHALHVIRVPLDLPLDAPMLDDDERAEASLAEAKLLGVGASASPSRATIVRARAIGAAIVERATRARRRPDRARLGAPLAAAVALLLADRRLRAAQGAVRGPDRRLPADGPRRGAGSDLARGVRWRSHEGNRDRLRARRLGRRAPAAGVRLGRHGARRERGRPRAARRAAGPAASSSATAWTSSSCARPGSRRPTRSSSRPTATTRTS